MTTDKRPLILVSNDDGFRAPGVHRLTEWLSEIGEVVAVCPDGPRSGQSMAITVNEALRLEEVETDRRGVRWYKVNGTPVDCIKLSMNTLFHNRKPDMVVAGINHGSNSAVNVVYSGTMGAVFEGCAFGLPSIGYSLTSHAMDADFTPCREYVEKITRVALERGLPEGVCLNVNIPAIDGKPGGMRVARACRGKWNDEYREYTDPHGGKFYWLTGHFINEEPEAEDTDEWCLNHGLVSVVPTMLDRTAPDMLSPAWLRELEK